MATLALWQAPYNVKAMQLRLTLHGRNSAAPITEERKKMLWTITVILFILWLVGLVSSYTLGGWIHILLVLAVIVLIFNLLSGRRAL